MKATEEEVRLSHRVQTFRALRHRGYRILWVGNAFSHLGWWASILTLNWWVLELTDSAGMVGLAHFLANGPLLVFALFGGVLADRVDRRWVMAVSRMASALLTGIIALQAFMGTVALWEIMLLMSLSGMARAFEQPANQALLPNLVERSDLLNATALNGLVLSASQALGPLAAGPVLATFGPKGAFVLVATMHGLATLSTLLIPSCPVQGAVTRRSPLRNLAEGFSYVGRNPILVWLLVLATFHCFLTMSYTALLPVFARDVLHGDATTYTLLMTVAGTGAVLGTMVIASLGNPRRKGHLLLLTGALGAAAIFVFASATWLPLALLGVLGMGGTSFAFMAVARTLVQENVTDAVRGRVLSMTMMFWRGMMATGALGLGALAVGIGGPLSLSVAGGFWIAVMVGGFARRPSLRQAT